MTLKEKVDVAIVLYTKLPKNIIIDGITYYLDIEFNDIIVVFYATYVQKFNTILRYTNIYKDCGSSSEIITEIFKEKITNKIKIANDINFKDYLKLNKTPKIIYDKVLDKYSYLEIAFNIKYHYIETGYINKTLLNIRYDSIEEITKNEYINLLKILKSDRYIKIL